MIYEQTMKLLGSKFVGFVLSGGGLLAGLLIDKISGAEFSDGIVWLFGLYAGGNAVTHTAGAIKDMVSAKKSISGKHLTLSDH